MASRVYHRPEAQDTGRARWQVVGAAVQGISHQRVELPCQDAMGYRTLSGGPLIIAVADGAGSAPRAELGAQCAVDAALDAMEVELNPILSGDDDVQDGCKSAAPDWDDLLRNAFTAARQALEFLSEEEGEPLRSYATTLICAAVNGEKLAVGQLGDGAVVAMDDQEDLFVVIRAQRGEYANETYFITQENALELLQIQVVEQPVSRIAVMSDGLTRLALKMPAQEPYPPFFQPLFAFAAAIKSENHAEEQLAAFLASERVCARTDDDKALVLAVRMNDLLPGSDLKEAAEPEDEDLEPVVRDTG